MTAGLHQLESQKFVHAEPTLLELGQLPVEDLAKLALREGQRPRQLYQVHKWFARRFGCVFRALLTASALPAGSDFWSAYYRGVDLSGYTILDPFVGGGTSIMESMRLGANVIGIDIDSVACAITRFESQMARTPDLIPTLETLKKQVGNKIDCYYRTRTEDGEDRSVLHFFWVQIVRCGHCGELVEAHPHHRLAYEAEGSGQWVFCPICHKIYSLNRENSKVSCDQCGNETYIENGPAKSGRLTCPNCTNVERLIDVSSREKCPPKWRLFALETLEPPIKKRLPMSQRCFRSASEYDQSVMEMASSALRKRLTEVPHWTSIRMIPADGRSDNRLIKYGYKYYKDIFNDRQLLHLSYLAEEINGLNDPLREAMAIAFSDHLITNCMMTSYAFGWRRLVPLFSLRSFRHITRPVELNPWIDGTGRGTFPNAVRQIQRAIQWLHSPREPLVGGGFVRTIGCDDIVPPSSKVIQGNSQNISFISDGTVDIVLTDPPYFDNISYSELSDFFLPWQQLLGLSPKGRSSELAFHENLSANGRNEPSIEKFQVSLGKCFSEIARVIKPNGKVIFTYQHKTPGAWYALNSAINASGLKPIQLFPLLGDCSCGLHKHEGSSKWDAVFVLQKRHGLNISDMCISDKAQESAERHYSLWTQRLERNTNGLFGDADKKNFNYACLVAGALGMFSNTDMNCMNKLPLKKLLMDSSKPISYKII